MNRILSVLLVSFFFTVSVFAQQNDSGIDKRFNFFKLLHITA